MSEYLLNLMLILMLIFRRSTLVGQRPMKLLLSVSLHACLSVRPSLNFLKIRSLVLSDIVHDDSCAWHLVTDGARFLKKKKIGSSNLDKMGQNQVQN